jgi:hypothetical protein
MPPDKSEKHLQGFLFGAGIPLLLGWIVRDFFSSFAYHVACAPGITEICSEAKVLGTVWALAGFSLLFGISISLPVSVVRLYGKASSVSLTNSRAEIALCLAWALFLAICFWVIVISTFMAVPA